MSLVSIRPYNDTEVERILDLWRAAGLVPPPNDPPRDIRQARARGAGDVFVAEFKDRLVATIMVGREEAQGWLYYLAVEPTVQRKGLGFYRRLGYQAEPKRIMSRSLAPATAKSAEPAQVADGPA
jgi:hypothetical protein